MTTSLDAVPAGYSTVTPWIIGHDTAGLMSWLQRVFDARELGRMARPDGGIAHAEMRIGDAVVMMFDARPEWPSTPAFLRLYVPDAETTFSRAVEAGAEPVTVPTHLPFGDKVGRVRDPFGNVWWLQQRVEALTEERIAQRCSEPGWRDAMRYVERAEIVKITDC